MKTDHYGQYVPEPQLPPSTRKPEASAPVPLFACPFCKASSVWSFGVCEWRCETCTREWNGSAKTALTQDGTRCARCNAALHETEKTYGCIMCAANVPALAQSGGEKTKPKESNS